MQRIWKVRAVKPYPEAHNHLFVGKLLERDAACIELLCRTFHFSRIPHGLKDVRIGSIERRLIPWGRIEVIHDLPPSYDFQAARLEADDQYVWLNDGSHRTAIFSVGDGRA